MLTLLLCSDSQKLNRDTWPDTGVRAILESSFLLIQAYNDSGEGQRFCTLYKVQEGFPVIAIIDPRTGELMKRWSGFAAPSVMIERSTQ